MEEKSQNFGLISLISLIYPCPSKKKEEGREGRRKGEVKKERRVRAWVEQGIGTGLP